MAETDINPHPHRPPTNVADVVPGPTSEAVVTAGPAAGPARRGIGPLGWVAAVWLLFIVVVAIVGPMLTAEPIKTPDGRIKEACGDGRGLPLYDPFRCVDRKAAASQRAGNGAQGKFTHWMGVDDAGADVFSQMVVGTRTSLVIAGASVGIAMLIGGALGLVGGYFRGRLDSVIAGLFDAFLAFPQLILALAIVSFLGRTIPNIIITISIVAIPLLGRIARASSLQWSEREFVMAAKALGAKNGRIMTREVLPNVVPALLSITFLAVGVAIVAEGSLSIIGLGVPSGEVSWGTVLAAGGSQLRRLPHMAFIPIVAITLTVMALNVLGDALRRRFDVRESGL